MAASTEPVWVHRHVHEPNPAPPSADPAFTVKMPDGAEAVVDLPLLQTLPVTHVADCWIVSTGHGKSGPFAFAGVRLGDLLAHLLPPKMAWQHVDVISADGFGARLFATEITDPTVTRPILLSTIINGAAMTRAQGLVRLIVPSEVDDALRQVKWVERIEIYAE